MKVNADPAARRTQAERTAATRARLLEAGRQLFAANGFAAVPTQAIVDAAGVTRGALYHQFGDKSGLFAEVYEEVERDLVTASARASWRPSPSTSWRRCALGVPVVPRRVLGPRRAAHRADRRARRARLGPLARGRHEVRPRRDRGDAGAGDGRRRDPRPAVAPDGPRAARRARRGGPVRLARRRDADARSTRCTRSATA